MAQHSDAAPTAASASHTIGARSRRITAWQTNEAMTLLVLGLLGWVLVSELAGTLLLLPWMIYGSGLFRVGTARR